MKFQKVPYYDLNSIHNKLRDAFIDKLDAVIQRGDFILGGELENFENAFADYCHVGACTGVGSGLAAIRLALQALGIGKNDEVIVPAHTYIATWLAVSSLDAKVIPVDACPKTMNINLDLLELAISPNTKAIIPVHIYGQMCEMDAIQAFAKKHQLAIIEDFAQAHGGSYKNQMAGSIGDVNATSFYPGKNLGALGDGGAITSNFSDIIQRVKALRNYGTSEKYVHDLQGTNSRLDSLQAAFLNVKLRHLSQWNEERRTIAMQYHQELGEIAALKFQHCPDYIKHVYHLFVIRTNKRNELKRYLNENGIGTLIHYPIPVFQQKAYEKLKIKPEAYPIASDIANEALSLPIYPGLQPEQVSYISTHIKNFFSRG